ncbi:MAG TPA: HAMP domain-containing sensor histidine kinase [Solirubrobacteraceae bacterium]|nr:HAMP domain-containing sensor histidine kinase [Solirubrobacteraceae bacterium]HVM68680.1 HAMP domain-containing sensor histidine kinase [Gaiellaceae bacterium]
MGRIRSLRNRLALLFGLIVLGAILVVYLAVVPPLEGELRQQKLDALAESARVHVRPLAATVGRRVPQEIVERRVAVAAARAGARVTLLDVADGTEGQGLTIAIDSQPEADPADTRFAVAEEAARSRRTVLGTEPTRRGRIAEVAVPLRDGPRVAKVAVFSDDLEAVTSNVAFIRRRMLLWGAIALGVAVVGGYLVARALTARVRRLEAAAHQVAAGDFSTRVDVGGDDELARLADAFEDMQRQLAQLQVAREQFIATASHELRTPVFSLGGFLELLADEELDDETRRQFVEQVRGQVDRLRKLTTELLDLSRMESGSLELRPEPTDLGALARDVAAEFTPAIQRHGADVSVQVSPDELEVECDPERVAQVLRILVDNALVHTPPGTRVTVSAARADGEVRLSVTDTGLGIKRQSMPHIFEPFFSSHDAQGAGLGLAIASELAGHMHGRLTAESAPGATRFTLVLPA